MRTSVIRSTGSRLCAAAFLIASGLGPSQMHLFRFPSSLTFEPIDATP